MAESPEYKGFDSKFTQSVIDASGPAANPRIRHVFNGLVRHLHDFMRENLVTLDELIAAVTMINDMGKMSNEKRDEGLLMADIFGLEVLADEISSKLTTKFERDPTASAVLGPFYRPGVPLAPMGSSIIKSDELQRNAALVHGVVRDFKTGEPIPAELDIWMAASNGMYDGQDKAQPDYNFRGRFQTEADGRYAFLARKPVPYPIPVDGPAGKLLKLLDRHAWRPAHIHFKITSPGYHTLVTQIFDRASDYCDNDAVFAVKDDIVVDFKAVTASNNKYQYELDYDFHLPHVDVMKEFGLASHMPDIS